MGVIQLCTCKITHLARVKISERKGKITLKNGVKLLPAPLSVFFLCVLLHKLLKCTFTLKRMVYLSEK